MKIKRYLLLIIVIFLLTIFLSGCINNNKNDNKKEFQSYFQLTVEIQTLNNTSFEVYLPIPSTYKIINEIIETAKFNGLKNHGILNTSNGEALKITGNNFGNITSKLNYSESNPYFRIDTNDYLSLTMKAEENNSKHPKFWLYMNSTNYSNIQLRYKFEFRTTTGYREWIEFEIQNIKEGWQIIETDWYTISE